MDIPSHSKPLVKCFDKCFTNTGEETGLVHFFHTGPQTRGQTRPGPGCLPLTSAAPHPPRQRWLWPTMASGARGARGGECGAATQPDIRIR